MAWITPILEQFAPLDFDDYVRSLNFGAWRPSFIVVHNTAVPNVAQRPHGFTRTHMNNLVSFYRDTQKWSAGPHAFVDQNGIWVFSPLTSPGVHSPSWNHSSWGIETLGDYAHDAFADPIRENLIAGLTSLHRVLGLSPTGLRFHKEDPLTTHKTCPGPALDKAALIADISARLPAPVMA